MYSPYVYIKLRFNRHCVAFQRYARVCFAVGLLLIVYVRRFFPSVDAPGKSFETFASQWVRPIQARGLAVETTTGPTTPLSSFLESHGLYNSRTIFLTMASKGYMQEIVNFRDTLAKWKLGENYVVLCLDVGCLEGAKEHGILAYDGYIMTPEEAGGDWHIPVARLKFAANIDLVEGGYNFIMLDGDVYLTGHHHPLAKMLPLEDGRWDIQFQSDRHNAQDSEVNIGWYWVRPTPLTREYFRRSQREWLKNVTEWDQQIMNDVRYSMIEHHVLAYPKSVVLHLDIHRATMRFDWGTIFTNETAIDAFNHESVIVHYTMIYGAAKNVVAKQFGHWTNESYYLNPPKILRPINMGGTTQMALDQMALAVHLSKVTDRHLMWPMSINHTCPSYPGGWKARAAVLIVDADSVDNATSWVEGTYLRNRDRYNNNKLRQTRFRLADDLHWETHSLDTAIARCREYADYDVLTVDFEGIEEWRVNEWDGVTDLIQSVGIKTCARCAEMQLYSPVEYEVC